jgi:hypothetical protein
MLNPGGAVKSIRVSQQQQHQLDRSSDDSNNSSSVNCNSGSWVLAGTSSGAAAAAEAMPAQGATVAEGPAAAPTELHDTARGSVSAAAVADSVQLTVQLLGCGQVVVYSSQQPGRVVLDGEAVGFSYDGGISRLEVVVPIMADACLDHNLTITWQAAGM